jgi:type IV secretion system protein VirD4
MLTTNHIGSEAAPRAHPVIASIARELLNKSENERSGVVSTAMSFLGLYRDPIIAANTASSDFRIAELMGGPRPVSLYLAVPPSDLSRTRPLIRMLLNQIGRRLTEQHETEKRADKRARLLLMLDEFPALGRLDFFESALAFLAGYGIRAFLVAQSLNQIDKAYGPNNAILDNCHVRVAFAPNDERTAKRLSDALGTATEERHQRNLSGRRFSAWLSHTTISHQETARPLLTPGEILQLPQNESLVFLSGTPPIRARKLHYYRDRNFLERRLAPPALAVGRKAGRGAAHDWAGFLRTPHPGLEREGIEPVTASGEHHDDGGRDQQVTAIIPDLNRGTTPTLFEERDGRASPDADDDSATIELPGGVRLS